MDIRKVIAKRIKLARVELELSQGELGDLIQVNQKMISKLESGDVDIRSTTLERLAAALDKPISFFFQGFDYEVATEYPKAERRVATPKRHKVTAR